MSAGLLALFDDVALLAKAAAASVDDVGLAAAKASAKAAGVVVDDTAVTPQYVRGLAADREVPIVTRIAKGSLRNKILVILPLALVLSEWVDGLLTPLLMLGGTYLCFEGAEKLWERVGGHGHGSHGADTEVGQVDEDTVVKGAVRTDFILSAEIMVIALDEVTDEPLLARAIILLIVAVLITVLVYGVVALIVRMDDVGLRLAERNQPRVASFGRFLVRAMPRLLAGLASVGTAAMLWVGGHILLVGTDDLGWHGPYDLVHGWQHDVEHAVDALGGVLSWIVNTLSSAVIGLVVGAVVVVVVTLVHKARGSSATHD